MIYLLDENAVSQLGFDKQPIFSKDPNCVTYRHRNNRDIKLTGYIFSHKIAWFLEYKEEVGKNEINTKQDLNMALKKMGINL